MPATIATFPAGGETRHRLEASARLAAAAEHQRHEEVARLAAERERERIHAIVKSPAASGRRQLAEHIAFRTSVPAALALNILESAARSDGDGA